MLQNKAKPTVSVKPEASLKREPKAETPTLTRVKPEIRNDSDEDFCEIIEPVNFSVNFLNQKLIYLSILIFD